jgi:hypothetical protein
LKSIHISLDKRIYWLKNKILLTTFTANPIHKFDREGEQSKKDISGCHLPHSQGQNLSITVASLGEQIPSTCS